MRKLAIVKTRNRWRRYWLALEVTHKDLKRGMNTNRVGLHLFAGYWYGRERYVSHKSHRAFGKISEIQKGDKVIGYARTSYLVRKLIL